MPDTASALASASENGTVRSRYSAHDEIATAERSIAAGQAKGTPSAGQQPNNTLPLSMSVALHLSRGQWPVAIFDTCVWRSIPSTEGTPQGLMGCQTLIPYYYTAEYISMIVVNNRAGVKEWGTGTASCRASPHSFRRPPRVWSIWQDTTAIGGNCRPTHIGRRDATKAGFPASPVGVETPTYHRKAATRLMCRLSIPSY
jgi:hypothetical protein